MLNNKKGSGSIPVSILVFLVGIMLISSLVLIYQKSADAKSKIKESLFISSTYYRADQIAFYLDQSIKESLKKFNKENFDKEKLSEEINTKIELVKEIYPELKQTSQEKKIIINYNQNILNIKATIVITKNSDESSINPDTLEYNLNFGRVYDIKWLETFINKKAMENLW